MKILYYDLETTGLDHKTHAIHQLSGSLEVDGKTVWDFDLNMRPFKGAMISKKALEVGGVTLDQLKAYPEESGVYKDFLMKIEQNVDRYNKRDKIFLCGYNNSSFDDDFLRQLFTRNGNKYFGAYFWADSLDVRVLAANRLKKERHKMQNFKLMTVAKYLGIDVDEDKAHDGKYDIEITKEVFKIVNEPVYKVMYDPVNPQEGSSLSGVDVKKDQ